MRPRPPPARRGGRGAADGLRAICGADRRRKAVFLLARMRRERKRRLARRTPTARPRQTRRSERPPRLALCGDPSRRMQALHERASYPPCPSPRAHWPAARPISHVPILSWRTCRSGGGMCSSPARRENPVLRVLRVYSARSGMPRRRSARQLSTVSSLGKLPRRNKAECDGRRTRVCSHLAIERKTKIIVCPSSQYSE